MNKTSLLLLVVAACGNPSEASHQPSPTLANTDVKSVVVVAKRTQEMKRFPCSECHDSVPTVAVPAPTMPPREPHTRLKFAHMSNVGDCYQCHDSGNLNQLRLLTGAPLDMDHAEELCGQCHPAKKRDWDLGIHGKQVGSWRGVKNRYACTNCHNPHSPARPTVRAEPPPAFPKLGIRKGDH